MKQIATGVIPFKQRVWARLKAWYFTGLPVQGHTHPGTVNFRLTFLCFERRSFIEHRHSAAPIFGGKDAFVGVTTKKPAGWFFEKSGLSTLPSIMEQLIRACSPNWVGVPNVFYRILMRRQVLS